MTHSFPTRRSSDLTEAIDAGETRGDRAGPGQRDQQVRKIAAYAHAAVKGIGSGCQGMARSGLIAERLGDPVTDRGHTRAPRSPPELSVREVLRGNSLTVALRLPVISRFPGHLLRRGLPDRPGIRQGGVVLSQ